MTKKRWIIGSLLLIAAIAAVIYFLPREQSLSATIVEIENQVDAHAQPDDLWETAVPNVLIFSGGQVRAGVESWAQLALLEGTVRLSAETVFTVKESRSGQDGVNTALILENGRLWVNLITDRPHEFAVETGSAVATVRDTRFSIHIAGGETLLSVAEGEATLTAQEESVVVAAGEQAVAEPEQPPSSAEPMSRAERTLWATEGEVPELAPPPPVPATIFTHPDNFQLAISGLDDPIVIDFEDIDANPINNTYLGREPLDEDAYAGQGISFANINAFPLTISPGGLFWNASNSLSVAGFPYDDNPDDTDDDLTIMFDPPVIAVGFTLIDNGTYEDDEFIQFIDADGEIIEQVGFPFDFTDLRAFVGITSPDIPIATINVVESPDGDDVNYDDFIFIR